MDSVSRRTFLQQAAGTAMLATAAPAAGWTQSRDARVRTGVIGTGGRGSFVMEGVLEHGTVASLCDVKPDRLARAAATAARDKPDTYADYRAVLDRKDIEAVVIATPPYLHAEMTLAALQAGKHVYCEKPLGLTPESINAVVEAAKASDRVVVIGQQLRSMKRLQAAVQKIREGAIGEVLMIKAQRHAERDLDHRGLSADWFFDVEKSGGYLIEMSVHNLDLCNWAVGAVPERAAGFGGILLYKNDPPGRSIMDGYTLSYDYPSGVKLYFTQMVFHPKGLPGGGQFVHVYGQKGAVDLMGTTMVYPLDGQSEPWELVPKQDEPAHEHLRAFYASVRTGAPHPADVVVGAQGALTAIMGHRAIVGGSVVEWKDLRPAF